MVEAPPAVETIEDPWQSALDAVFQEKFSQEALARQAESAVSLREEARNFLGIAENLLGFQAMRQYAAHMCGAGDGHLEAAVSDYLNQRSRPEHQGHDHGGHDEKAKQKSKSKKKPRRGWMEILLARG